MPSCVRDGPDFLHVQPTDLSRSRLLVAVRGLATLSLMDSHVSGTAQVGYLLFDGLTSSWQERLFKNVQVCEHTCWNICSCGCQYSELRWHA